MTHQLSSIDRSMINHASDDCHMSADYYNDNYDSCMSDMNVYYRSTIEDMTNRYCHAMSVSQHDIESFRASFLQFVRQAKRKECDLVAERNDLKVRVVELEQLLKSLRAQNQILATENTECKDLHKEREAMMEGRIRELQDLLHARLQPQQQAPETNNQDIDRLESKISDLRSKLDQREAYYEKQLAVKDGVVIHNTDNR